MSECNVSLIIVESGEICRLSYFLGEYDVLGRHCDFILDGAPNRSGRLFGKWNEPSILATVT